MRTPRCAGRWTPPSRGRRPRARGQPELGDGFARDAGDQRGAARHRARRPRSRPTRPPSEATVPGQNVLDAQALRPRRSRATRRARGCGPAPARPRAHRRSARQGRRRTRAWRGRSARSCSATRASITAPPSKRPVAGAAPPSPSLPPPRPRRAPGPRTSPPAWSARRDHLLERVAHVDDRHAHLVAQQLDVVRGSRPCAARRARRAARPAAARAGCEQRAPDRHALLLAARQRRRAGARADAPMPSSSTTRSSDRRMRSACGEKPCP